MLTFQKNEELAYLGLQNTPKSYALLRQPLVHFIALGAAFFALFALVDDTPQTLDRPQIVVSIQDARWLASQYQATWNRTPTEDEMSRLMDEFVREEIYVREALAYGLDQGDTIVRRRLRQKMEFITEAGAEAVTVSEEDLKAYYEANAAAYRRSSLISFDQVFVPEATEQEIADLRTALEGGSDFQSLGTRSLLPPTMTNVPRQAVDGTFGSGVFDRISELQPGVWTEGVPSGYGQHLVRLNAFDPGEIPPFEALKQRVEQDWRRDQADKLRTARYAELLDGYEVVRPSPAEALSQ